MNNAVKTDRYFGIGAAILSLLFLTVAVPSISGDWQSGAEARYFTVGPRLFPYIAGTLTLIFGLLIALKPEGNNKFIAVSDPEKRNNFLRALGISVAYVALLDVLGFVIATILALIVFFLSFGEYRWGLILPIAIGVPVLTKLFFLKVFIMELPTGIEGMPF